nr:uncharacterized protein LOC122273617 [Parasteatoda tepidariorum]
MFPLCRKCTDNLAQTVCQHTDEERSLIGTWVSEEVKLAIKKGYRIVKIYEVYNFKEKSNRLFRSYIDLFLKIKQESSGWPANCVSPEDKLQYIQDYKNREGIDVDPTRIEKNPGRRAVSKAFLNNFWGRWAMNLFKPLLTYVNDLRKRYLIRCWLILRKRYLFCVYLSKIYV